MGKGTTDAKLFKNSEHERIAFKWLIKGGPVRS
jgi:hypothetical protein